MPPLSKTRNRFHYLLPLLYYTHTPFHYPVCTAFFRTKIPFDKAGGLYPPPPGLNTGVSKSQGMDGPQLLRIFGGP